MSEQNNINEILAKVKLSLRLTTDAFDSQLVDLIQAALIDLSIAGANGEEVKPENPLVMVAIATYCKMNFKEMDASEYDKLKKSYDEQKAQMATHTGYTVWGSQ